MNGNLFASIAAQIFALILTVMEIIVYFMRRNKINTLTKIYFSCIYGAIFSLILEIVSACFIMYKQTSIATLILSKCFIGSQILLFLLFTLYTGYLFLVKRENIDNKENKKYIWIFLISSFVISIIVGILFPVKYSCGGVFNSCAIGDPFMKVSRILAIIGSSTHGSLIFLSRKKIKGLNMWILVFAMMGYLFFFFYYTKYGINIGIATTFLAISSTGLFLTTENQDSILLQGFDDIDKQLVNTKNNKESFLLNLSHFYRSKYTTIMGLANTKSSVENNEIFKNDLLSIEKNNNELSNFSSSIMDIIDLDAKNVILNNNKYLLGTLLTEIGKIKINDTLNLNINSNEETNTIEFIGDKEELYKVFKYLIISTNHDCICNDININVNKVANSIVFNFSFYNAILEKEKYEEDFDTYFQSNNKAIESYNVYLIAAKKIISYLNGKIEFNRNDARTCTYVITLPVDMSIVEVKNEDLGLKIGGDINAL